MYERPNVIWLTLDSVRADHTTMGGYHRDTTPNMERIAGREDGDWYSECISHGNSTRISTASITTGTNPSRHGVRGNRVVPDELKSLPEMLSEAGYHTACLSRSANSSMGFDKGFDDFRWISSSTFLENVDLKTMVKYGLNLRKHSAGFTTDTSKYATPFIINDMSKRWLKGYRGREEPFFMYLHYNEPHRPYHPPLSYIDEYTDEIGMSPEQAIETAMDMHRNMMEIVANGCKFTDDEWEALKAMYDAEIKYTDYCVGRLFDYVDSMDWDNDTVFVITADHGESFGERGLLGHRLVLHDSLINVPLVTTGIKDSILEEHDLVQHSDVIKTMIEMANGESDQIDGFDMRKKKREFAVSQEWESDKTLDRLLELNPDFDDSRYHRPLLTSVRTKEYKYQKSEVGSELFRLPDEDNDVSEEEPEVAKELDETLVGWMKEKGQPISSGQEGEEFSEAMKEQLSDLGYLVD